MQLDIGLIKLTWYLSRMCNGWVIENLGMIPRPGLSFDYENIHVTVTRSNNRKVHEVEVEIKEKTDEKED